MATRNPANVIEFGKFNYGATMTDFVITAAADVSGEVNPGEEMEAILEAVAQKGTVIGLGAESGGAFNCYVENSSWDAADLETAVQALGGTLASATVADAGL